MNNFFTINKNTIKSSVKKICTILVLILFLTSKTVSASEIIKIAITGGNCAGKSMSLDYIKKYFEIKNYNVQILNEVATDMYVNEGITAANSNSRYDYQKEIAKRQIEIEEKFYSDLLKSKNENTSLIICDRGLLDGKAFMDDFDFSKILKELSISEKDIYKRYDAIFHLVSVAKVFPNLYRNEQNGNPARKEKIEEAKKVDDKLLTIWSLHPYHKVINTFPTMEEKIDNLISEIEKFLNKFKER